MMRAPLPIDSVLPEVIAALRRHGSLVVQAPTGAGKTTRVPPAILDAGLAGPGRIVMLEPRRLAARAAARRMADERDCRVGAEVGYQVRFDKLAGPDTRILVVTPGILLRWLHDDPLLESVGAVLFDEFHERGLESDLALGMVRLIQQTVRPELQIVAMSATLEAENVSNYLGRCPVVISKGRTNPVEIVYQPRAAGQPWPVAVAGAVKRLLDRRDGDVLVFLPGLQEIRQTARELAGLAEQYDLAVLPLHGDLPAEQQDAALLQQTRRKVVLATNVAESSVTVEGIGGVVDTGLARIMEFDPAVGLDRLRVRPISRSSAEQRAGRAGRTRSGVCIRLWSDMNHRARPEQTEPEIRRVDLASTVLQMLCWGEKDPLKFPWMDPPTEPAVAQAKEVLRRLGALSESHGAKDGVEEVTELGRLLGRLPVHPRLGRLLIEGQRLGQPERAALAAALLSERDPFSRSLSPLSPLGDRGRGEGEVRRAGPNRPAGERSPTWSDLLDRLEALEEYENHRQTSSSIGTLNRGSVRFVLHARNQVLRLLRQESAVRGQELKAGSPLTVPGNPQSAHGNPQSDEAVLRALLAAFPDRLARRREPRSRRGVLVGGRGVRLAPSSGVLEPELFLCIDVDSTGPEVLVRQASAIRRDWLPPEQVTVAIDLVFDPTAERVSARRRVRYLDLVLEESAAALSDDAQVAQVLEAAAAEQPERVLPPADSPARRWITRVQCLRQWMPELELPDWNDSELCRLLPELCPGCRSFAELRHADWQAVLQRRLTPKQFQAVEREAPERLTVPSGSRLALVYEPAKPPLLAVRIQEVFGLAETPRIAAGRVPVLLHLLAPNQRPQQVTDDLASFWANTYPQVRKELRVRYPKHAWPEDPLAASPERQPARKREG
jgi:ATP-dependent helicase HrpB